MRAVLGKFRIFGENITDMILRFTFKNVFSFADQSELSMIPNTRLKTLQDHIHVSNDFGHLKMAAIYGANGAGKSNVVKAIAILSDLVKLQASPSRFKRSLFRLRNNHEEAPQLLAIEFIQEDIPFYYAIEIKKGLIATEELYISGLGKAEDQLIFERTTNEHGATSIKFSKQFEADEKSQILKSVLLEEFVKPDKTILKLISKRENHFLAPAKTAYAWFEASLNILTPNTRPLNLTHAIAEGGEFKEFAEGIIHAVGLGIKGLSVERKSIDQFTLDQPNSILKKITKDLDDLPDGTFLLEGSTGEELNILRDKEGVWVEKLLLEHSGNFDGEIHFETADESDGTIRILDFIPAIKELIDSPCVYVIDEIERSIHPTLIKSIIQHFAEAKNAKGQLIFTTHEAHLLDQDIFRQDEIWFVEKNSAGISSMYSLNDFKEHKTIDIQKGYLNGRYGAVPFLGNLNALNWG